VPNPTATPAIAATAPAEPATEALAVQTLPDIAAAGGTDLDLDVIVETLTARTVDASTTAEVRRVVDEVAHEFDDARVRTFLPLLVLKEAQDRLRARGLIRPLAG